MPIVDGSGNVLLGDVHDRDRFSATKQMPSRIQMFGVWIWTTTVWQKLAVESFVAD